MESLDEANTIVQDLTIELLKVFLDFCEENHLRYYFTGGALIGVLRHNGFIPWDDDIDIGMPRKDYDKFLELISKDMPEGYGICSRHTNKEWHFAMSQFVDLKSTIEINIAEKPRRAHVWIDVFPLDGLPSNKIGRWLKVKYILLHRYLIQIAYISTQVDSRRARPMIEKIVLNFFKIVPIGKLLNTNKILNHLDTILRRDDFDKSEYAGNMLGRYREREIVPQKYFGKGKEGRFENLVVKIPDMSHELQTNLYGDYMKLPPETERMAHNVKIIKCRQLDK